MEAPSPRRVRSPPVRHSYVQSVQAYPACQLCQALPRMRLQSLATSTMMSHRDECAEESSQILATPQQACWKRVSASLRLRSAQHA